MDNGTCNTCGGTGVVGEEQITAVCCRRPFDDGECCGEPEPEQGYAEAACPECYGEKEMTDIESAMNVMKQAFKDDPSFAYGWHANIAMACNDAIHGSGVVDTGLLSSTAPHAIGNDAASRIMKICFDVETSNDMLL